jgi:hypothetical protein
LFSNKLTYAKKRSSARKKHAPWFGQDGAPNSSAPYCRPAGQCLQHGQAVTTNACRCATKAGTRAIEKCQRLIMLAHMDTAKFLCTGYCSSLQALLASSSWSMYSGHHETPDCSQPDCLASRVSEQHGSGFALAALFASILQWAARGGRGIGGNFATRCYRA